MPKKLDGTETCSYCGRRADEIPNFRQWRLHDYRRYCEQHGANGLRDYVKGNLDINSKVGCGRSGEILVIKTLGIGKEHDCNRISCGHKFDLYHKDYSKIDVKTSLLSNSKNSHWKFNLFAKKEVDTYICVGLSFDRNIVEHVWIVPNEGEIRNLNGLVIYNAHVSLSGRSKWEVVVKPYNDMWQTMKLDNCKIMVDKNKVNNIGDEIG